MEAVNLKDYTIYIVLTRTQTVISKLIQILKKDEYTHAAIALDKDLEQMYSFGRKNTYNPFVGKFRKEHIDEGVYNFCDTLPGVIIEVSVSKQQYEKAKGLVNHFITNCDLYKYNYQGLFYTLLNKGVYREDRFLCSEFVYYILKESKIVNFKKSGNLIRPQNLLDIKGKMVYKGNLKHIEHSHKSIKKIKQESFFMTLKKSVLY